jgi:hypothetical protein
MPKRTPADTTQWVASGLRESEDIMKVEVLSDQVLRISREDYDPYIAGIVSAKCVEADTIRPIVKSNLGAEIIINVPKVSYWTGGALSLAKNNNIATGAYGDLYRVLDLEDVRSFQSRETEFIERGLNQHSRVSSFERIYDRVYRISRARLPDITAAMLHEYELTADHLRTARAWYGDFSVAVITDPSGRAMTSAEEAAETMDVEILKWGAFLSRLTKK